MRNSIEHTTEKIINENEDIRRMGMPEVADLISRRPREFGIDANSEWDAILCAAEVFRKLGRYRDIYKYFELKTEDYEDDADVPNAAYLYFALAQVHNEFAIRRFAKAPSSLIKKLCMGSKGKEYALTKEEVFREFLAELRKARHKFKEIDTDIGSIVEFANGYGLFEELKTMRQIMGKQWPVPKCPALHAEQGLIEKQLCALTALRMQIQAVKDENRGYGALVFDFNRALDSYEKLLNEY